MKILRNFQDPDKQQKKQQFENNDYADFFGNNT